MLHKSFKSAKCKTSLKLAVSRIKLLRNKKDVHLRQLKGDLAKLLESGQEQTARIRVEHFVREEKSKEAYELVEIFCELIVARMPMIESQKNCPIDLKEAVSSVIFASPRCADIPELIDVSKHIKAKYGKDFVSAAVELRPECGVNRMLVEKLSAKAPDGQSKIKILTAIAKEYNIKWDPKSFGDNINPPADLLNGPNTSGKASYIQMEPISFQPSIDHNNKGTPCVQVPLESDERQRKPENSPERSLKSNHHSQQSNLSDVNANQSNFTGHHNSDARSSEGMRRYTNYGDQNNYSSGSQHWSMEFKDAASAAKAAAESAELASRAARAAAELSIRENISQPFSSEFQKSPSNNLRAEGPYRDTSVNLQDQQLPKDQVVSAPRKSSMSYDYPTDNDTRFMVDDAKNLSYPSSSASNNDVITTNFNAENKDSFKNSSEPRKLDDNIAVTSYNAGDRSLSKNLSEHRFGDSLDSMEKQHRNVDVEYVSDQPFGMGSERTSSYEEVRIGNDSNKVPTHKKPVNDTYDNPFAMDKPNNSEYTVDTSFNDHASVVFDDYEPDDDYAQDYDYQRRTSMLELSSPKGKVSINSAADDTWIFKQDKNDSPDKSVSHSPISEHVSLFSGNVVDDHSHSDDLLLATFDHSESEQEPEEYEIIGKEDSKKQNSYDEKPEWTQNISHELTGSSDEENRSTTSRHLSSELPLVHESKKKYSPPSSPDIAHDTIILEEATSESCSGLNFEILKGGLRNQKCNTRRPYASNSSRSNLPSNREYENDASKTEQSSSSFSSTARTSLRSNASREETRDRSVDEKPGEEKGSRATLNSFKSNHGDTKEVVDEIPKKPAPRRVAVKYPVFHDDDEDSEEDSPGLNVKYSPSQVIGVSRRTKASKTPSPRVDSYRVHTSHEDVTERKASRSYYGSTSPLLESSEQPQSSKPSKRTPETKRSYNEERLKSSAKEQQSNDPQELDRRGNFESSKFSSSREKTAASVKTRAQSSNTEQPQSTKPSKPIPETQSSFHEERSTSSAEELPSNYSSKIETQGNSESSKKEKTKAVEKASHVHPKLPDYDNFAAHFHSLRQNNK